MSTMTVTRVPAAGVANGAATAADGSTPAGQQAAANGPAADGAPAGPTTLTLAKAINLGLRAALAADPRVLLMGEDIGRLGGKALDKTQAVRKELCDSIDTMADEVWDKVQGEFDRGREWTEQSIQDLERALEAGKKFIHGEIDKIRG